MISSGSEVRAHLAAIGCKGQEISRAHLAAIGCNGLNDSSGKNVELFETPLTKTIEVIVKDDSNW